MRALRQSQALEAGKPETARRLMAALAAFVFACAATLVVTAPASAQQNQKSAFSKPNFGKVQKFDGGLPLHLQADELVYDSEGSKVIAKGNVEIQYENNNLNADEVIYDQAANTLSAQGNVVLRDANGNIVRAERYTLTDDFRDGFVQSLSVVAVDDSKISAEQGIRRDGNVTEFKNAKFTPCRTDGSQPPLWCIAATTVTHDQVAKTISYQDAQFEMFGVPIFGLPYFEHPDPTVKRKSGFLAPSVGTSGDFGFFAEIPYYFALSPSYDFVFHPRYMTGQGVLWMGDWRQRFANGQYTVELAGIDQDSSDLPGANDPDLDGFRGSIATRGDFSLSSWWRTGWDITLETDDSFRRFYRLDSILLTDRVNNIYFTGMSDRNYFATNLYQFTGLLGSDTPTSESRVHPVIDYDYVVDTPVVGGELSFAGNALSLSRTDGVAGVADQEMARASLEVNWRRRLTDSLGITYTPFGELRGDLLQFNNYRDAVTAQIIEDDAVARGLAAGGVTVAYPWIANTAGASHIIEPIGQVIARSASVNQNEFPVEDARSLVFDDTNLFDTNKFSGWDRLETGTRANVGLQYTFQPWTGGYARVLAGQSYQLSGENPYENRTIACDANRDGDTADPGEVIRAAGVDDNCNPVFSPNSGLETSSSDYVLAAYIAPTDNFRLISQNRFDDHNLNLKRQDSTLAVNYGPITLAGTYTYTLEDPELGIPGQQDMSGIFDLRLTDRWSILGGLRYDIDDAQFITNTATLRYLDDCFMLSVTYDEYHISDPDQDIEPDQTLMFRLEYKYLGGFNYSSNISQNIPTDQQPGILAQ